MWSNGENTSHRSNNNTTCCIPRSVFLFLELCNYSTIIMVCFPSDYYSTVPLATTAKIYFKLYGYTYISTLQQNNVPSPSFQGITRYNL